VVGRSRGFWRSSYDRLQELFPHLRSVPIEDFHRTINKVEPSLVRVEADEVTYNLHVIQRFELERDVLAGRVALRDLPEAFDEKLRSSLGVEPRDVVEGVLQDVHWADLAFGSFPGYTLGNVISLQLWERILADVPELPDAIEEGEFGLLRDWLRERVHRTGRTYTPKETLARAVGGPLDAAPYLRYLRAKVAELVDGRT
jgi:carboxypeptidase Taq